MPNDTILIAGLLCCIVIFVQDWRERMISIAPVALLFTLGLIYSYTESGWEAVELTGINLMFTGSILALVFVYFRVTGRKKIMDEMLGWGDVAMFAALTPWVDPPGYALFYALSVLLILAGFGVFAVWKRPQKDYPIPLAGLMGLLFIFYLPVYLFAADEILGFVLP